jgi:hypothetical protein
MKLLFGCITPNEMYLIITKNHGFVLFFHAKIFWLPYIKILGAISRLLVPDGCHETSSLLKAHILDLPLKLRSYLALSARDIRKSKIFVSKEYTANIVLKILTSTANNLFLRATTAQNLFFSHDVSSKLPENLSKSLKVKMGRAPRSHESELTSNYI